jgi:2-dehydro-3-deoxyphosphogluconate aldolase/(4S)-4-hydroxy-2-oxoglutarate aldolase
VLDVDTVKRAVDAGAQFIVSPGLNPKVVSYCVDNKIAITPGALTPTELEMAMEHGLRVVKFFPAEPFGGLKTIQALAAPYAMMRFIPTGGIGEAQLAAYLAFKPIVAVGGAWMVGKPLLAEGKFDEITRLARRAADIARGAGR